MTPEQWIVSRDTGVSSKTIWAVMMGVQPDYSDTPGDGGDFGRCYRLLQVIPAWRERLPEVAERFPKWGPLVREWDRLTALYEADVLNYGGQAFWVAIQALYDECMVAGGWTKTGSCTWSKREKGASC